MHGIFHLPSTSRAVGDDSTGGEDYSQQQVTLAEQICIRDHLAPPQLGQYVCLGADSSISAATVKCGYENVSKDFMPDDFMEPR